MPNTKRAQLLRTLARLLDDLADEEETQPPPEQVFSMIPDGKLLLSPEQTAERLSFGLTRTYEKIRRGETPAIKEGGRWYVSAEELQGWVRQRPRAVQMAVDPEPDIDLSIRPYRRKEKK